MEEFTWYNKNGVPENSVEIVFLTFSGDMKLCGHFDIESESVIDDHHKWNWEEIEFWIKLPHLQK